MSMVIKHMVIMYTYRPQTASECHGPSNVGVGHPKMQEVNVLMFLGLFVVIDDILEFVVDGIIGGVKTRFLWRVSNSSQDGLRLVLTALHDQPGGTEGQG